MNCDRTIELLSERLKGLLDAAGEAELERHLADCAACREEAAATEELWSEMGRLDDDDMPHERMRARFHAALAAYEERARSSTLDRWLERVWPRRPALQAGLAVALLLLGVAAGRSLPSPAQREIAGLRQEIRSVGLVLLDHQSATERLRGVEWARRLVTDDGDDGQATDLVVDALLDTVRHDPNLNVRLAAAEALDGWIDRPRVARGLTDSLAAQDAPLMQVTLAGALLDGKVDGAVPAVRRMLDREGLDPSVRDYLRTALDAESQGAPRRGSDV